MERERQQAVTAAEHAQQRGNHAEVVRLLQPHAGTLSGRQRRMLEEALAKGGQTSS